MPIPTLKNELASENKFELCPAENIQSIISGIYYVGYQPNTKYEDEPPRAEVIISFELGIQKKDGTNHVLSKTMGWSLHEKSNLAKSFKPVLGTSWPAEGQSLDLERIIGLRVMCQVAHIESQKGTKAFIASISKMPIGIVPMVGKQNLVIWSYDDPGAEHDSRVPTWIRNKKETTIQPDVAKTMIEKYWSDKRLAQNGKKTEGVTSHQSQAPVLNLDMQTRQALTTTDQAKMAAAGFVPQQMDPNSVPF